MDSSSTPVKLHLECPNEDDYVKDSTVELKATMYPSASFWALTGKFIAVARAAHPDRYQCVFDVRRKYSHYFGSKPELAKTFNDSFDGQDIEGT